MPGTQKSAAGAAAAVPQQVGEPNLFDLTGRNVAINYSTTSLTGEPRFHYQDEERDLNFAGGEIATMDSPPGTLVTVTLANIPDARIVTLTLVVPKIRLVHRRPVRFATLAVETTDRSGAFVPPPGPTGVLQTYRVLRLRGVAQEVDF